MLLLLCCGFHTAFAEQKTPSSEPNQPDYAKLIEPNKLKEDLDFLFKTIEEVHPNMYAYTTKDEFTKYRDELYNQIDRPMSRQEFYKLTAPVVASLKNMHTTLLPFLEEYKQYSKKGGKTFPLELRWDGSKATLAKNYSSAFVPIGGEVLTINGRKASKMFMRFSHWIAAEHQRTNPWLIEYPVFLRPLLLLEYGPVDSWDLEIKATNSAIRSYTVPSLSLSEFINDESAATIERKKHYRIIREYDTAVIEFYKWLEPKKLGEFFDETFRDISAKKVSNLIIDIRENTGGSDQCFSALLQYLTAEPLVLYEKFATKICPQTKERIASLRRELPDKFANTKNGDVVAIELPRRRPPNSPFRFRGQIFFLIGRHSFSASTVFAAAMKCAQIATLVGEETGDPTIFYADSITFELPNSCLQAWVASKLLVCACGKPDGRGVIPDYEVEQKPEDTAKGIDTVMQFTLDLIKKSNHNVQSEAKKNNQVRPLEIERKEK